MPIYEFICQNCHYEIREFASVSEKKSGDIKCSHCGSGNLQEKYSVNTCRKDNGSESCRSCSGGSCGSCG